MLNTDRGNVRVGYLNKLMHGFVKLIQNRVTLCNNVNWKYQTLYTHWFYPIDIVSASFTQLWSTEPHFDAHEPHCTAATSTAMYANIGFMRKNMQMNHFTPTPHVKYAD